jgi:transposase InsO family protein
MQSAGFQASMSRRADRYDNAPMESFFHTLKTELVHHRKYATPAEATRDIFAYIEGLLQSNPSSLRHRLYQPDRDGAESSLTLSIYSGEDQRDPTRQGPLSGG